MKYVMETRRIVGMMIWMNGIAVATTQDPVTIMHHQMPASACLWLAALMVLAATHIMHPKSQWHHLAAMQFIAAAIVTLSIPLKTFLALAQNACLATGTFSADMGLIQQLIGTAFAIAGAVMYNTHRIAVPATARTEGEHHEEN